MKIIYLFLITGNLLTLLILGQKDLELKPIFRSMLSLLLISDTICILLINIIFTTKLLSLDFAIYILPHIIPWLLPITQIFLTISVYTTIGVAVERFVSISTHTPPRRVRPMEEEKYRAEELNISFTDKFQLWQVDSLLCDNILNDHKHIKVRS